VRGTGEVRDFALTYWELRFSIPTIMSEARAQFDHRVQLATARAGYWIHDAQLARAPTARIITRIAAVLAFGTRIVVASSLRSLLFWMNSWLVEA